MRQRFRRQAPPFLRQGHRDIPLSVYLSTYFNLPLESISIPSPIGCVGRLGIVFICPAKAYKNPAPTDALISITGNSKSLGLPFNFSSCEMDKCFLAIQTGKSLQPNFSKSAIFSSTVF